MSQDFTHFLRGPKFHQLRVIGLSCVEEMDMALFDSDSHSECPLSLLDFLRGFWFYAGVEDGLWIACKGYEGSWRYLECDGKHHSIVVGKIQKHNRRFEVDYRCEGECMWHWFFWIWATSLSPPILFANFHNFIFLHSRGGIFLEKFEYFVDKCT